MYAKVFPDSDMSKEDSVNTQNVNRTSSKNTDSIMSLLVVCFNINSLVN